jgi:hypothetical protein
MPTPEQLTRLANVRGWIRTAKEAMPAINHGRNAVAAEQVAQVSALLDRMHRRALAIQDAVGADIDPSTLPSTLPATLPATTTGAPQNTAAAAQRATEPTERDGRRAA